MISVNNKPNFFCVGMQKAGTSWLYKNLKSSNLFYPAIVKEPHYYDMLFHWARAFNCSPYDLLADHKITFLDSLLKNIEFASLESFSDISKFSFQMEYINRLSKLRAVDLTDEWYESIFELCPPGMIIGDFTADTYLIDESGVKRILGRHPNAKFLMLVRDPVERDWSQLRMITSDFSYDNIKSLLDSPNMLGRNKYEEIINVWSRNVPSENFAIYLYDDIVSNPISILNSVTKFLGIYEEGKDWVNAHLVEFKGVDVSMPEHVKDLLSARNAAATEYYRTAIAEKNYLRV